MGPRGSRLRDFAFQSYWRDTRTKFPEGHILERHPVFWHILEIPSSSLVREGACYRSFTKCLLSFCFTGVFAFPLASRTSDMGLSAASGLQRLFQFTSKSATLFPLTPL